MLDVLHYKFSFLLTHESSLCEYQGESAHYLDVSESKAFWIRGP